MATGEVAPWSIPFWEGSRLGELRLPWCADCGQPHFPPRPFCPHCWGGELEWRRSDGWGRIYTFTVVTANPPSRFLHRVPFGLAIIRLDEGVQLLATIEGKIESLACDIRVRVGFKEIDGELLLAASPTVGGIR